MSDRNQSVELVMLGRALRRMREAESFSAEELASAADITRERIDALEAGRLDPTYELLLVLAEALGTKPSSLVALAERLAGGGESGDDEAEAAGGDGPRDH